MHDQIVFNTYQLTDFTTLRFALPSVLQVKGNFVLILALASNRPSVVADEEELSEEGQPMNQTSL